MSVGSRDPRVPADSMGRALDTRGTSRRLGDTVLGSSWVIKALHPCGEGVNVVPKIPDGSYDSSVVLERRSEYQLAIPSGISTVTSWDLIIVSTPFLCGNHIAIAYDSSITPTVDQLESCVYQAICISPTYSTGVYTSFTTTNTYYLKVLTSSVLDIFQAGAVYSATGAIETTYFRAIRRTYHGMTATLDAPSLSNQGRIVSCQFPPSVSAQYQSVTTVAQEAWISEPPALTFDGETQADLKAVQCEATMGAYIPSRMYERPAMSSNNEWYTMGVQKQNGSNTVGANSGSNVHLRGWGWSVAHFSGLSTAASVRLKVREGLELTVNSLSPYSPFLTPSYPDDTTAIRICRAYFKQQAHAYPASYNALNKMIPELVRNIGSVLSVLGIPHVGNLSSAVASFLTHYT